MQMSAKIVGGALLALVAAPAAADPIPLPETDFVATATMQGLTDTATVRHHDSVLRMEMAQGGQQQVFLMDFAERTAVILVDANGMKMAMEMPASETMPEVGADIGAEVVGSDTVAGEDCEVWRYADEATGSTAESCITEDGIWLRMVPEGGQGGFEVTSLERTDQDPALFEVPEGYTRMPIGELPAQP